MRFRKIKRDKEGVLTFVYQKAGPSGLWDEHSLVTREAPHSDLILAFQALAPSVLVLCELTGILADEIQVRGVTLAYPEEGDPSFTISALRSLAKLDAPLVLNTPLAPWEFDVETTDRLGQICTEALAFLLGKRAQLEIFAVA